MAVTFQRPKKTIYVLDLYLVRYSRMYIVGSDILWNQQTETYCLFKDFIRVQEKDRSTSFGVCKIVFNDERKSTAQLVEVKCIGDDALFLGQSQSVSVWLQLFLDVSRIPYIMPPKMLHGMNFLLNLLMEEKVRWVFSI